MALALLKSLPGKRRKAVAADKGHDVRSFLEGCRRLRGTPHGAAKDKGMAMDRRALQHIGYAISEIKRKRGEEPFGWMRLIAQLRQVKQCGKAQVRALFQMGILGGI